MSVTRCWVRHRGPSSKPNCGPSGGVPAPSSGSCSTPPHTHTHSSYSAPPPSLSILSSWEEGVAQTQPAAAATFLPCGCVSCSLRHPGPARAQIPAFRAQEPEGEREGEKGGELSGRGPGKPWLSMGPQFTPPGNRGKYHMGLVQFCPPAWLPWLPGLSHWLCLSVSAVPAVSLDSSPHPQHLLLWA